MDLLKKVDILCDVGGIFDKDKMLFDHHQSSFAETWNLQKQAIKLSSAGLIFKYFGQEAIKNAIFRNWNLNLSEKQMVNLHRNVYSMFIEEIDANDNGIDISKTKLFSSISLLPNRVYRYNRSWNAADSVIQAEQYKKAMRVVEDEFMWHLYQYVFIKRPAYDFVKRAFEKRFETHQSGEIMELEQEGIPFRDVIREM